MARFLTRSQLARVTPVLGHHYRSSLGLFSTAPNMKTPLFENPNKYFKRTEEQNEKHRKVKQLAKKVVILSCESTANCGVCDVYVLGVTHNSPESCREVQAITSYLKPQLLFLELCKSRSFHSSPFEPKPNEYEYKVEFLSPQTSRDIIKDLMGKRIDIYKAYEEWSAARRFKKNPDELEVVKKRVMNSEFMVAYQEALKYGITVVLGDRPIEITEKRYLTKMSFWQRTLTLSKPIIDQDFIDQIKSEVIVDERDKYMAHQLLEVATKNKFSYCNCWK